jgi:pyruvate dehydrogenase E2 component (dihydrolipoamide acetyltransferase)
MPLRVHLLPKHPGCAGAKNPEVKEEQDLEQAEGGQRAPVREEAPARSAAPASAPKAAASAARPAAHMQTPANGRVKASPLAKQLAEEKGIDISRVPGSGPDGRVTKADVENFTGGAGVFTVPQVEAFEEVPVSQMRKTIAKPPRGEQIHGAALLFDP